MLAIILLGSFLLFSLIWFIIYCVSRRSNNPDRSTRLVLQMILFISILTLIVQDYILKEDSYNSTIIVFLLITLIFISSFQDKSKSVVDEYT
ncbi:membrane-associated HD superfamily phosphohydrolase [Paenibacillus sp. W4I10]|nr:membrane-associated HD superfamily phosphohydrolase [Paenibacillus sp. W4I10]